MLMFFLVWSYGVVGGISVAAMNEAMIEERIKLPAWARFALTVAMLAFWPFVMFSAFIVYSSDKLRGK